MTKLFLFQILLFAPLFAFTQPGILDDSFASGGEYILFDNDFTYCYVEDMILDSQGRIMIFGAHTFSDTNNPTFVLRLHADGTPDLTFAEGGILKFEDLQILGGSCFGIAERPNGHYILGTTYLDQGNYGVELIEIDANGQINTDFGDNGIATSDLFEQPLLFELALTGENKIVVSYTTFYASDFVQRGDCVVHQFLPNGEPDMGFGTNGKTVIGTIEADERIFDIDIDNDNNIYVSGYGDIDFFTPNPTNGMVISLNSNGQLRSDWGTDGIALYSDNSTLMTALGVDIAANGDVLCAGASYNPSEFLQSGLVTRLNASGQLIPSFGTNGFVLIEMTEAEILQVRETQDLSITATGVFLHPDNDDDVMVVKMTANGDLMGNFGNDGMTEPWDLSFGEEEVKGMAIQTDGKIIVAGFGFATIEGGGGGEITGGDFIGETGYVLRYLNDVTNAVELVDETQLLSIFPNPAHDFISIRTENVIRQVELCTMTGRLIQTSSINMAELAKIDLVNMVAGMYLIRVQFADGEQSVVKFVKH